MLELQRATDNPAVKLISTRSLPAPVIYYDESSKHTRPEATITITVGTTTDKGLAVFCCRTHFIGEDVSIEVANNTLQNQTK